MKSGKIDFIALDALLKRAVIYAESKQYDQAIADFNNVIELSAGVNNREFLNSLHLAVVGKGLALALVGRFEDAVIQANIFCDSDIAIDCNPVGILFFFVTFAASGRVDEALKIILGTKAEKVLEPLAVALKMLTDTPYRAPREVVETAKDIVKRINEREKEMRGGASEPPAAV